MNPFIIPADARSWIDVPADSSFPIQNLPFGLACLDGEFDTVVTRIGDTVIDLCELSMAGLLPEEMYPNLQRLSDLGVEGVRRLRAQLFELLRHDAPRLRDDKELRDTALVPIDDVEMQVPMDIPAFVDFYSGINHASNVGRMFRPDQPPLLPNYRHLPVGYNGRASSVVVSGESIDRPRGQTKASDADAPTFGPTRELDFELELGFFIGAGNDLGEPIDIQDCESHILGLVLVNDWSARDVQRWEYQPLGPFLAKSFRTSVSPWIVTLDALEPFRCAGPVQEPVPLPHLRPAAPSHYDITLEVSLQTSRMVRPQVITRTNARELYWSFVQQLAHQTSNGTNTEPGDLYASGTISGAEPGSFGSLLELSWRGSQPLIMEETGEVRTFLEDGDTVTFSGWCDGDGYRIGLGEVTGTVEGVREP